MNPEPHPYTQSFYNELNRTSVGNVSLVSDAVIECARLKSVVDVGCGTGTWLRAFKERGIQRLQGIDGPWIAEDQLKIDVSQFMRMDLAKPTALSSNFDLAISLEVAEHLPPEAADDFVSFLCSLSDMVLFGSAAPGQGGTEHLNEQWPEYWKEKFEARGFEQLDVIRPKTFHSMSPDFWYVQNTILYVRRHERQSSTISALKGLPSFHGAAIVHPLQQQLQINRGRITLKRFGGYLATQFVRDVVDYLFNREKYRKSKSC